MRTKILSVTDRCFSRLFSASRESAPQATRQSQFHRLREEEACMQAFF